jgi:hypothetical protein
LPEPEKLRIRRSSRTRDRRRRRTTTITTRRSCRRRRGRQQKLTKAALLKLLVDMEITHIKLLYVSGKITQFKNWIFSFQCVKLCMIEGKSIP